jgi:hypothetical protein
MSTRSKNPKRTHRSSSTTADSRTTAKLVVPTRSDKASSKNKKIMKKRAMEIVQQKTLPPITSIAKGHRSSSSSTIRGNQKNDSSSEEDEESPVKRNLKPNANVYSSSSDSSSSRSECTARAGTGFENNRRITQDTLGDENDEEDEEDSPAQRDHQGNTEYFIPAPNSITNQGNIAVGMFGGINSTTGIQQSPSYRWKKIDDQMKQVTIDKTSVAEFVVTCLFPKLKFITGSGINMDYSSDRRSICSLVIMGCNKVHSKEGMIWWETAKKQVTTEIKRLRNDATKSMKFAFLGK